MPFVESVKNFLSQHKAVIVFVVLFLIVGALLVGRWLYENANTVEVDYIAAALVKDNELSKSAIDSIAVETAHRSTVHLNSLEIGILAVVIALFAFGYLLLRSDLDSLRQDIRSRTYSPPMTNPSGNERSNLNMNIPVQQRPQHLNNNGTGQGEQNQNVQGTSNSKSVSKLPSSTNDKEGNLESIV